MRPPDAVLADDVPKDRGVFAVEVEDLLDLFAELRQGGHGRHIWWPGSHSRPMLARGIALNIISHAVGLCAMFQSPRCQSPPISQFSNASRTPFGARVFGQRTEDFGEPWHAFRDGLVHDAARETGDEVPAPNRSAASISCFQAVGGAGHFVVGQRIAVHAEAGNDRPAVAQGLLHFGGHPGQVGRAQVLPKHKGKRLEPVGRIWRM